LVLGNVAYVRAGAVPRGQDVKTFDYGNLIIGTNGIQGSAVNLGELWVTYQVKLIAPRLFDNLGLAIGYFNYVNFSYTMGAPLGNGVEWTDTHNSLACVISGGKTITFPKTLVPRKFILTMSWTASGGGYFTPPTILSTNSLGVWNPFVDRVGTASEKDMAPVLGVPNPGDGILQYGLVILPGSAPFIVFNDAVSLPGDFNSVQVTILEVPSNAGTPSLQPLLLTEKERPRLRVSPKQPQLETHSCEDCEESIDKSIENDDEVPEAMKRYLLKKGIKL
jgi:hypothetical protein